MKSSPHVFAAMLGCALSLHADEITCTTCDLQGSLRGNYAHHKDSQNLRIDGAGDNPDAYREDIEGTNFTVSVAHLPAGKYKINIGEVETVYPSPADRVFAITVGATTLASNYDILATAGSTNKVTKIEGTVDHEDDSIGGALTFTFTARTGTAKFNTIEIKDASGASVVSFNASDFADSYTTAADQVPVVPGTEIWKDSSQPINTRIDDLVRRMSLAEKVAQLQNDAPGIPRLGLPAYNYWNEALHGVANDGIATVFPEPIGGAATWDPELLHQEGHVIGTEGRAKFNEYASRHNGDSKWWDGLTFWTPNINIFRDPRWGRGQETYGEDPFLTGTLAVPFIKGIQGDDPKYMLAMACAKHYAVHNGPESQRHRFNANPPERDLYETYLPQFEMAVREGHVGGVMGAYSALYGVPDCANPFLLTNLLRKQWGFKGYVVSDCGAISDIWSQHHYVKTPEEAAAAAVNAGCDLCCGGDYNALVRAVQQGLITEKDIDRALSYTLWTRFKLGLFDPPDNCPYSKIGIDQNDTPQSQALALKIAEESIVLLKNDGILPLDRSKIKRIAVIGPNGDSASMLHGNYNGTARDPISILNGIRQVVGPDIEITFAEGCPITTETKRGIAPWSRQDNDPTWPVPELNAEALSNAANADLIIYVGGITSAQEGEEFDRDSIELPEVQEQLVEALHATGKPMIMVNCSGSAMALPWEATNLPAILQAWYPGEEGGLAIGEVLFGDINPSGHLPVTFYASTADLPNLTDYSMSNRTYRYFNGQPLYAFGHGLSYTKFDFSRGKGSNTISVEGTVKISFTVKNSGNRDGDEVPQIYFRHINSSVPQPKLALCGFERVHVKRGESATVSMEIPAERLRFWDTEKKQYVIEPGQYEFLIGEASDDVRLKLPMTVISQ